MRPLAEARCANHADREAVARCPECGRYVCRECVTEHDRRVLCAACLRDQARGAVRGASRRRWVGLCAGGLAGWLGLWLLFYLMGQALLLIPSSFHEGSWWESLWQGRP